MVEARGVALKPGQVVDDTQPLILKEGQRVTLIAENGNTLKLHGPYDQPPVANASGGGANLAEALQALVVQKQQRTSEIGVVRGARSGEESLPDPWVLNVTQSGNLCARADKPIIFWRPKAGDSVNLTVVPTDRSWKLQSVWQKGVDRIEMPDRFVAEGRATYLVGLNDEQPIAVTLYRIPAAATSDAMRAAWMIDKQCAAQAQALLQHLK